VTEPDFAILVAAANRCLADRLVGAVATAGGERMRPSFGFVLRAVAAEEPTISRLAELLGVTKQAASRLADDMVTLGFLLRSESADRRRKRLRLSPTGERVRERFGGPAVDDLRRLLVDFVERHGGGEELAAQRSRASAP
jgi:DNA-binding MarR family transcriptional regulator